jgi:hypothetical protein
MEENKIKLRPVVYTNNYFKRGAQNTAQQMFLLKALQVTQDPQKLRQMMGVKTVAEVYRTLDKLAMRKEYHSALARAGISFDFIVSGIKQIALTGFKDGDKLKAYQTLLKSVGLEKYDSESAGSSGTWEEELLKSIEAQKDKKTGVQKTDALEKYDVKFPEIPESARKAREEEAEMTSSIYENKK